MDLRFNFYDLNENDLNKEILDLPEIKVSRKLKIFTLKNAAIVSAFACVKLYSIVSGETRTASFVVGLFLEVFFFLGAYIITAGISSILWGEKPKISEETLKYSFFIGLNIFLSIVLLKVIVARFSS